MTFKENEDIPPIRVLKRVSLYFRTVRYEWRERGLTRYGPAFPATLQEWERAL